MTIAISRHNECYRMLAVLSSWLGANRGCGVAIERVLQYSTNRSAVAHVRGAGEDPAGAGGCQPRAAEDHCGAAQSRLECVVEDWRGMANGCQRAGFQDRPGPPGHAPAPARHG